MIYLESPSTDAEFNLALEQYVFDEMDRSEEYFMLWQNANAVIIGKNQNTIEEISQDYVKANAIQVVRRLSGGGAVYHDLGNLNFTFIVGQEENSVKGQAGKGPEKKEAAGGERRPSSNMDMAAFCVPIQKALAQLGVKAEINGRNDITIEGRKFSGNSQYIREGRIMHHGTLMFDSDLAKVSECLKVSGAKIESKGIKSVKSRVTNIRPYLSEDISLEEFKRLLIRCIGEEVPLTPHVFTEAELARAEEIRRARYGTWEWNYGYSPRYRIRKEARFEGCGKILLFMDVKNGCLADLAFYGDYFGNGDTSELAARLAGCPLKKEEVLARLSGVDVEEYFNHLNAEELADRIVS